MSPEVLQQKIREKRFRRLGRDPKGYKRKIRRRKELEEVGSGGLGLDVMLYDLWK
jgi:hypothetical protein